MAVNENTYYVPAQSKLPLFASAALFLTVFGAAHWLNGSGKGPLIFLAGALLFATVLWSWFSTVINENMAGLNSHKMKRSYVWAMGWFIFSEVMFFAAFFGALFYVRTFAVPWLGGLGDGVPTREFLWPEFSAEWPLMTTPDMSQYGDKAVVRGPDENLGFPGFRAMLTWLPLWNTIVLIISSFTVHLAHGALKDNRRSAFNRWLGISVLLGMTFIVLQAWEYHHAYTAMGLQLHSGIYGSTFFILTGFHGAHVTIGTIMLLIMWLRSVLKNHFKPDDSFGFEAASWYWHFVDVVWVILFFVVYIF